MPLLFYGSGPPGIPQKLDGIAFGPYTYNEDRVPCDTCSVVDSVRAVWGDRYGGRWNITNVLTRMWPGSNVVAKWQGIQFLMHGNWDLIEDRVKSGELEGGLYGKLDPGVSAVTHVSVTPYSGDAAAGGVPFAHINGSYYRLQLDTSKLIPEMQLVRPAAYPYTHWQDSDGSRMGPVSHGLSMIHFGSYHRAVGHTIFNKPDEVSVFNTSTGETISKFKVAGRPVAIFAAYSAGWCFVAASSGVLTILDYLNGRIVGVVRQRPPPNAAQIEWGWSAKQQMLYRYVRRYLDDSGDEEEPFGEIELYWPTPIPVALQDPIPLKAPRPGRRVPFLTRAFGDTSEGVVSHIEWGGQVWSDELDEEGNPLGWQDMGLTVGTNNAAGFNQATAEFTQDDSGASAEVTVETQAPYHPDTDSRNTL